MNQDEIQLNWNFDITHTFILKIGSDNWRLFGLIEFSYSLRPGKGSENG